MSYMAVILEFDHLIYKGYSGFFRNTKFIIKKIYGSFIFKTDVTTCPWDNQWAELAAHVK